MGAASPQDMLCCCVSFLWGLVALVGLLLIVGKLRGKIRVSSLDQKAVLITGCDSGFGHCLSQKLDKLGMKVFATCMTQEGAESLASKASSKLVTLLMDVTSEDSVLEAYEVVKKECPKEGLYCLVNNAGIFDSDHLELSRQSSFDAIFNVNVLGLARVTRVFVPLIKKAKGRIVNVSSVAGRVAGSGTSAYSGSKFAVQGMSDAWRRELKDWGVKVIIIEPGIMKTPLWDNLLSEDYAEKHWQALPADRREQYGKEFFTTQAGNVRKLFEALNGSHEVCADAMKEAVTARWPPTRRSVGKDTPIWIGLSYLPTCVGDWLLKMMLGEPVPKALQKQS